MKRIIYLLLFSVSTIFFSCKKKTEDPVPPALKIIGFSPKGGAANTTVEIYGNGFSANKTDNLVKFNGVQAEILEVSPNKILVASPEGITPGKITVNVGSATTESTDPFIANLVVVQGKITSSITWTSNYQYLLVGKVEVMPGVILTIQPGTTIKGDKVTKGSLFINNNGYTDLTHGQIIAEGTIDKPIIFTSSEPKGARNYGDWGGIYINGRADANPNDNSGKLKYVRIEFAGAYVGNGGRNGGLVLYQVGIGTTIENIQVSYCGDRAFIWNSGTVNGRHLISFRTYNDDFTLNGGYAGNLQYALALRDPFIADASRTNCITDSGSVALLTNFTCIGGTAHTRNVKAPQGDNVNYNFPGNGRGILFTGYTRSASVYNSVFVGSWLAGISLDHPWTKSEFENGTPMAIECRNNAFAGTATSAGNQRGGTFSFENIASDFSGFESTGGSFQLTKFNNYGNKEYQMDLQNGLDDLGLVNLASYSKLTSPNMIPGAGSPLSSGAMFTMGSKAGNSPFFDKTINYIGAFGTVDWTQGWANWDPQIADY